MALLYQLQSLHITWTLLPPAILVYICGTISVAIYWLLLHPLSRFPGPRKAAATGLYRTYYDVWENGGMIEQVTKLHKIYGQLAELKRNGKLADRFE